VAFTRTLKVLLRGPVPKLKSAEFELVAFHGGGEGGGGERKRGRVGGRRWSDLWLVSRKGDEDFGDRRSGGLDDLVSEGRVERKWDLLQSVPGEDVERAPMPSEASWIP
jgi:hypothetical protein